MVFWAGKCPVIFLMSFVNSSRGMTAHCANLTCNLSLISAAAAFVKVTHKIVSGTSPCNSKRNTLSIKTFVLPVPAFAETKTDLSGEAASR